MPSTYSTNLALELMATGEDNGIWGTTTNTNLGTLIEQSIVATGSVVMADANQTIAMTNGTSCAARCFVLNVTGPQSAARNLTVPTVSKPYLIANNTSGGFALTVKTAAGTSVSVPNGARRLVYVDATNVVEFLNNIKDLTISGTATIGTSTLGLAGNFATAGAFALTLTTSAATNVTLPITGTLSTLAGAETLTNKTLTAPALGAATATSINKVAITAPATGSTLTIADGKTLTASNSLTFTGTDGNSFAYPAGSDTVVTLAASQTLTNKTLTAAALGSSTATTQARADNTTKVATDAYADRIGVQQIQSVRTGAFATDTTVIPMDNTIPQNTEGTEYMTLSITPKSATSTLGIEVVFFAGCGNQDPTTVALFQDATANALIASNYCPVAGVGAPQTLSMRHTMLSGTTSATTFKVRAGTNAGNAVYFNGFAGVQLFGGVSASSITITEYGI